MGEYREFLVVGGPRDGDRIHVDENYPRISLPLRRQMRAADALPGQIPNLQLDERVVYRKEFIHTPVPGAYSPQRLAFFMPEGFHIGVAIAALLENYRPLPDTPSTGKAEPPPEWVGEDEK